MKTFDEALALLDNPSTFSGRATYHGDADAAFSEQIAGELSEHFVVYVNRGGTGNAHHAHGLIRRSWVISFEVVKPLSDYANA